MTKVQGGRLILPWNAWIIEPFQYRVQDPNVNHKPTRWSLVGANAIGAGTKSIPRGVFEPAYACSVLADPELCVVRMRRHLSTTSGIE